MESAQKIRFFAPVVVPRLTKVTKPMHTDNVLDTLFTGKVEHGAGSPVSTSAVEDFANGHISVPAVKRFTARFGPLWTLRTDSVFSFRLRDWEQARWQFRTTWDSLLGLPSREVELVQLPPNVKRSFQKHRDPVLSAAASGGTFELTEKWGMVFIAESLYHALVLNLLSLSGLNKLRRCRRPSCDYMPYFIAEHVRQRYCNENCAAWGQQQFKKAWWKEHGDEWRSNRERRA